MATSKRIQEILGDVTECPICTETMEDPKCLPCIHTFCLKCLNQNWKGKKPGDSVPCPLCRMEFPIPAGGFSKLAKNHFIEKLLEAEKLSKSTKVETACDICSSLSDEENEDTVSPATKYCCDCEQHMCQRCAKAHLITKGTKQHQVLSITEIPQIDNFMKLETQCDVHAGEIINFFCMECKVGMCTACFIIEHSGHRGADVNKVAEDLKSEIKRSIEETRKLVIEVNCQAEGLEKCSTDFVANVIDCESRILKRGEEMKRLIDQHVKVLLEELTVEKAKRSKEIEMVKEEITIQKISLESYIKYSQTVLDKASSSDVVRLAKDLIFRADNLHKSKVIHVIDPVEVKFIPAERSMLTGNPKKENIVGSVRSIGVNSSVNSSVSSIVASVSSISLESSVNSSVSSIVGSASSDNIKSAKSCSRSYEGTPSMITSIQFQGDVRGVAVVGKELFVAVLGSSEIKVHNTDTYSLQTSIKVPGLSHPYDMVADDTSLFVSEVLSNNIHRIKLPEKRTMTGWKTAEGMNGLSITKQGSVLVTCYCLNKLFEYSTDGIMRREIVLQSDIKYPYRAIQLDNDQFLISHETMHRVCLIDNKGMLIKSSGGTTGTKGGPLKNPRQLVVDQNGFILVADSGNNRVVLLDSNLEFVKDLVPPSAGINKVFALHLVDQNGKLYVSDDRNNKLAVFQL